MDNAIGHLIDGLKRQGEMNSIFPEHPMMTAAAAEIERLRDRAEQAEAALHEIDVWSRAYPLKVFPEPDFAKVRELLGAGGITLDAVSASNMRHVVEGVGKIARHALGITDQQSAQPEKS